MREDSVGKGIMANLSKGNDSTKDRRSSKEGHRGQDSKFRLFPFGASEGYKFLSRTNDRLRQSNFFVNEESGYEIPGIRT